MGTAYEAILMSGGTGRRLGGRDKAGLPVQGRPMVEYVLDAVRTASRIVVVGPRLDLPHRPGPVRFVREDPPGSGPLAGLAAGVRATRSELVVVLACDLPLVTVAVVDRLLTACATGESSAGPGALLQDRREDRGASGARVDGPVDGMVDGAVLVDGTGRRQPLAAAYRRPSLVAGLRRIGPCANRPVRLLTDPLRLVDVPDPVAAHDVDTWDDLRAVETRLPPPQAR